MKLSLILFGLLLLPVFAYWIPGNPPLFGTSAYSRDLWNNPYTRWQDNQLSNPGDAGILTIPAIPGRKHVVDCIGFSAGSISAVAPTVASLILSSGGDEGPATGGELLWSTNLSWLFGSGQLAGPLHVCGLNLAGGTGKALQLKFPALSGVFLSLVMIGYDIPDQPQ